jgi:hypothetical protein
MTYYDTNQKKGKVTSNFLAYYTTCFWFSVDILFGLFKLQFLYELKLIIYVRLT